MMAGTVAAAALEFLGGDEVFLVLGLDDIDDDKGEEHEVEGGLAHGFDLVAEDLEVGAAFGDEHDADEEEDEEAEDLVDTVFLQEIGDAGGEDNHEDAADDDGSSHEDDVEGFDDAAVGGDLDGGEDGVEGEDEVDEDDHGDDLLGRDGGAVLVAEVDVGDHVEDLFHGSVEDEATADEFDDAGEFEVASDSGVVGDGPLPIREELVGTDDDKEKDDSKDDRDGNPDGADAGLVFLGCTAGFEGNVEEVVEAEDGLDQHEHQKGEGGFYNHGGLPCR